MCLHIHISPIGSGSQVDDDDGTEDYFDNGDFDANIEGSGNNGIETELPVPELDDNQIEYTIDKLKPCTLYTFDLNVVGEKDKVTTKAKTNCAESIATTSKPTGLQKQAKINYYRLQWHRNIYNLGGQTINRKPIFLVSPPAPTSYAPY